MAAPLRVLIIEDSESDAGLIIHDLERAGYAPIHERVATDVETKEALQKQSWDIVIADYNMPQFNALAALRIVQESGRDIPFIVLSGTMGEETAVAMMKAGAHDYVMKDNRARLIPAVQRELSEVGIRRMCRYAEEALRHSEERYRALYNDNPSMYFTIDGEGKVLSVNKCGAEQLGYSAEELVGLPVLIVFHPDDREAVEKQFAMCMQNPMKVATWEFRKVRKDGNIMWVKEAARAVQDQHGNSMVLIVCEDITERKQAEEALRESEERYRSVVDHIGIGISLLNPEMEILTLNKQMEKWFPLADISKKLKCYEIPACKNPPPGAICPHCPVYKTFQYGLVHENVIETTVGKDIRNYRIISSPVKDKQGNVIAAIKMVDDITENKKVLEALEVKSRHLEDLNTTLRVLLNDRNKDKAELGTWILANVENLVIPYVEKLKNIGLDAKAVSLVTILEKNLKEITSSFSQRLSSKYLSLTSRQIQIANLVKEGKTSKEISDMLNISEKTVDFHRKNIRSKLGIQDKTKNLMTYLLELD
ncbi:MAG TPA: PAS domain S-box protein [Syntrophales bacterium]|nr:PAS domain S-box protein [Syntrophales bacterium]